MVLVFLVIILYSIKNRSAQLIFNLNCFIFFLLSNFCIIGVNSIYKLIVNAETSSMFLLYHSIILVFILTSFLCALLNYLIKSNCISDLNAYYLSFKEVKHLYLLIYIYGNYFLFISAFLRENSLSL